ncbi:MAG: hypothetical protein IPK13_07535 [Deltaproteobacteria bacterium]|nr:hypothetical protein [Deltaproteobacteria bacterium]
MPKNRDELASFKIRDLKRPEVRSFTKAQDPKPGDPAASADAPSVGFPAVEARLERGTIEAVADELRPSYEALEALERAQPKLKHAARKSMAAYERAADLFEYLFATKAAMGSPSDKNPGE